MANKFYFYYKKQRITFHHNCGPNMFFGDKFEPRWTPETKIIFNGSWHAEFKEIGREIESNLIFAFHTNFTNTEHFDEIHITPQYDNASSPEGQTMWSSNFLTMSEKNGVTAFSPDKRWQYSTYMFYSSILTFIENNFDDNITFDEDELRKYLKFKTHFLSTPEFICTSQKQHFQTGVPQGDGLRFAINQRNVVLAVLKQRIKYNINKIILDYEHSGNKFSLFAQAPDRADTIKELVDDLKLLLDSDMNTIRIRELQLAAAVLIQRAINHTRQSHKDKIGPALFGITKSRLARRLTNYINHFLQSTGISQAEVNRALAAKPSVPHKYAYIR